MPISHELKQILFAIVDALDQMEIQIAAVQSAKGESVPVAEWDKRVHVARQTAEVVFAERYRSLRAAVAAL